MSKFAENHEDLEVFRSAYKLAMEVFELTQSFPKEERYSLTDQIRRSSRSVCANLAEAWQRRKYPAAFAAKITDAMSEAGETQTWLRFAADCKYIDHEKSLELHEEYKKVLKTLQAMAHFAPKWCREERSPYGDPNFDNAVSN